MSQSRRVTQGKKKIYIYDIVKEKKEIHWKITHQHGRLGTVDTVIDLEEIRSDANAGFEREREREV